MRHIAPSAQPETDGCFPEASAQPWCSVRATGWSCTVGIYTNKMRMPQIETSKRPTCWGAKSESTQEAGCSWRCHHRSSDPTSPQDPYQVAMKSISKQKCNWPPHYLNYSAVKGLCSHPACGCLCHPWPCACHHPCLHLRPLSSTRHCGGGMALALAHGNKDGCSSGAHKKHHHRSQDATRCQQQRRPAEEPGLL